MIDYGSKETDELIAKMEKRMNTAYYQAEKEMKRKLKLFLKDYNEENKQKKKDLKAGKISQEDYDKWLRSKAFKKKHLEEMVNTLAEDYTLTDVKAMGIVRGFMPEAYAINRNFAAFQVEKDSLLDTSFALYDAHTVQALVRDRPNLLPAPSPDIPKELRWHKQKITNAITQGILQGESIDGIATRLRGVTDMDRRAAIRNARTATTAAQNSGRIDSYKDAEKIGIKLEQEWLATLDGRTRHSHRLLDGERVKVGGKFSNGCRYPGDPQGDPAEIYNCRCTLVAAIEGIDQSDALRNSKLGDMSYEEWKYGHKQQSPEEQGGHTIAEGADISGSWVRRPDKFDFEIEDVINAQGFDGVPRVVSAKEFDELVKQANGGSGFVAQRTYSAPDQETLDAYREQLYYGKWYVDCSTGGAQYGRGMYCAADYTGTLSDGIKAEMEHYKSLYYSEISRNDAVDIAKGKVENQIRVQAKGGIVDKFHPYVDGYNFDTGKWKPEFMETAKALKDENPELYGKLFSQIKSYESKYDDAISEIKRLSTSEIGIKFKFDTKTEMPSYTETFTFDKSARIILHENVGKEFRASMRENLELISSERGLPKSWAKKMRETYDAADELDRLRKKGYTVSDSKYKKLLTTVKKGEDSAASIAEKSGMSFSDAVKISDAYWNDVRNDFGSMAARLGYDAINAEGHGESGSYTVVLNRTKLIVKGEQ